MYPVYPSQSYSLPAQVSAAQTGLDMNTFLPMMIQMMMVMMVMKMMTSAVGGISGKKETKPVVAPVASK